MHEYRRFVEREMDKRQWNPNQVAQHAGLNRQTVYDIVQDTRESLNRIPSEKTISGLASAFGVGREKILAAVAEAMGLPIQIVRADVSAATNDELMSELSRRLREKAGDGDAEATPITQAGGKPAEEAEELVARKKRLRAVPKLEETELFTPPPPAEETAALHGPNRGREMKEEQDRDAERSQDPEDEDGPNESGD